MVRSDVKEHSRSIMLDCTKVYKVNGLNNLMKFYPPNSLYKYKVLVCSNCGELITTMSDVKVTCTGCRRRLLMYSKGRSKVKILRQFDNPNDASLFVREYKRRKAMGEL